MNRRFPLLFFALSLVALGFSSNVLADTSHARIVRLSLVQGDVRFAPSFHDDPLTDANAGWQPAPLNLPIRQGFVLATDNGRAEVEFENGAMMFLGPNTVVEFYDLSLQDGARISRLVLRQGTTEVYVNPANDDYFSLTGGDFTVEAAGRSRFRLDNFDDGSTVSIEQGRVDVLRDNKSTPLAKGQSLSAHASDPGNFVMDTTKEPDDFDHWVSGRIDSVATATAYSTQYVNSPGYSSGFADLYTYGSWYPMAGYGYCWRPFGMSLGWSPFDCGAWYTDASWGPTFIGFAPWGWLPYHYGGWIFSPIYGWVWAPVGFGGYGGPVHYRPVTAVWVHNGSTTGLVPLHPSDKFGRTARNLNQGIYPVQNSQIARTSLSATGGNWSVLKQAPGETLASPARVSTLAPPTRVSRTILSGTSTTTSNRVVGLGRESSITYDPVEHRYVNSAAPPVPVGNSEHGTMAHAPGTQVSRNGAVVKGAPAIQTGIKPITPNIPSVPNSARVPAPPRAPAAPAPAHTSSGSGRGYSSGGGASWGGGGSSHPSSVGGGGGSSHPSSGGSGGGSHPH